MEGRAVQPRRRWYRLHATTWFAAVFAAASLAVLNLLGDPNKPIEWITFGWPLGFAKPLATESAAPVPDAQWRAYQAPFPPAVPSTEDLFGPITEPLPGDASEDPMTGGSGAGAAEANPADNPFGVPPPPPPARSGSLDDLFAPPVTERLTEGSPPARSNPFGPPVADPFGGPVVSHWLNPTRLASFHVLPLAANIAIVLAILAGTAWCTDIRCRRGAIPTGFALGTLMAITAWGACYIVLRKRHDVDFETLDLLREMATFGAYGGLALAWIALFDVASLAWNSLAGRPRA